MIKQKVSKLDSTFDREMIIKPFNMATMALEIYERMEFCLQIKKIKLAVNLEDSFETSVMVDSEMAIKAVSDILWWSTDFLKNNNSILIIAAANNIELLFPSNKELLKQFQVALEEVFKSEGTSALHPALNFIYKIRGKVEIPVEKQRIQITFPIAK